MEWEWVGRGEGEGGSEGKRERFLLVVMNKGQDNCSSTFNL